MKGQDFTREFRDEAVRLGTDQRRSHREAAERVRVPPGTLSSWVRASKKGRALRCRQNRRA